MKMIAHLAVCFGILLAGTGCGKEKFYPDVRSILEKPHQLRRLFSKEERVKESSSHSSWSGGFFLVFGGAAGSGESDSVERNEVMVTFAWRGEDGVYTISTVPLSQVAVKIVDQKNLVPTATFQLKSEYLSNRGSFKMDWKDSYGKIREDDARWVVAFLDYQDDAKGFFQRNLARVVIACRESDWPAEIHLPLNE